MGKLKALTSESLVIGAAINNPNVLLMLSDLKVEFFSDKVNKFIYTSIKQLFKQGAKTIDIADIYALIEVNENKLDELNKYGGIDYLDQLQMIGEDKKPEDVAAHAENIIECAYKNEMIQLFVELKDFILVAQSLSRNDINKKIEERILEVKSKYSSRHQVKMIGEKTDELMEIITSNDGIEIGFETSLPLLSKFVTYRKGELTIYSAKAKVGKSQLVVNECYSMAIQRGIPVMILDTELQTKTFFIRLMARITGYTFKFIESGRWKSNPACCEKVNEAKNLIDNSPISHTYIVGWTQDEIYNEIKRMKIQYDIQVVIYDYIKVEEVTAKISEHQLLGNITNWLKNGIAGDLDLAVIALAQMSDYVSDDRGIKIANSEKIKNYASTVIFLLEKNDEQYARDMEEAGGNAYLYVSYNRNGPQMKGDKQNCGININFEKNKAIFKQAKWQLPEIEELVEEELDENA